MSNRGQWSRRRQAVFFDVLRRTANVSAACRAAGVPRGRAYALRRADDGFRREWHQALEEALDDLEAELRRRAMDGVDKPVFYAGKECGSVRTYSDALGMFILKSRRPAVFGGEAGSGDDAGTAHDPTAARSARDLLLARLGTVPPQNEAADG